MASTVSLKVNTSLVATKTPTGSDAGNPDVTFTSGTPGGTTYNATSTPPVSLESKFTITLGAGAYTLDLTAIPDDVNATFDGTGLKVQFLRVECPTGNANGITFKNGATNGYRTDATTTASLNVTLAPGQKMQYEFDAAADAIGSTHKTFDCSGTGAQTILVHIGIG